MHSSVTTPVSEPTILVIGLEPSRGTTRALWGRPLFLFQLSDMDAAACHGLFHASSPPESLSPSGLLDHRLEVDPPLSEVFLNAKTTLHVRRIRFCGQHACTACLHEALEEIGNLPSSLNGVRLDRASSLSICRQKRYFLRLPSPARALFSESVEAKDLSEKSCRNDLVTASGR